MARILEKLRIREVSAVDRGAGEGVKVMLMKATDYMLRQQRKEQPMSKSFTDIVKGMLGFGKASVADEIANAGEALAKSIDSILADSALDPTAKSAAIAKSFDQHAAHLNGTIPAAIETALSAAGLSASDFTKGTPDMAIDFKKALGLPADATDEQVTKALADQAAAISKQAETATALAKVQHELAVSKMSPSHGGFMEKGKMPAGGKEAFAGMSAAERDAHMSKNPLNDNDGDEATNKRIEEEVAKRLASDPAVVGMQKRLGDLESEKALMGFQKRAIAMGIGEAQGVTLQKAMGGDATAVEALTKLLEAATNQAREGGVFKEFGGSGNDGSASPHDEVMAKAHELRKAKPDLSIEQAYAKVYEDPANYELAKRDTMARRSALHG